MYGMYKVQQLFGMYCMYSVAGVRNILYLAKYVIIHSNSDISIAIVNCKVSLKLHNYLANYSRKAPAPREPSVLSPSRRM